MRACPNCTASNPTYMNSCRRCNAPLSTAEQERRERRRILNEAREAKGKEPLPLEETDESVGPPEPTEGGLAVLAFMVLFITIIFAWAVVTAL